MYRRIIIFFILCIFTTALSGQNSSVNMESPASDFLYELNEEGSGVIIYGYIGKGGDVVIPSEIEGFQVVQMETLSNPLQESENSWGNYTADIKKIIFPDTITVLGVFYMGSQLNFKYQNSSLEKLVLPANLEIIPSGAFCGCTKLVSVSFPKKLKKIEREVFADCSSLTNVELPKTLREIEAGAFYNCKGIINLKLPEKLKIIENQAFENCIGLQSLSIPYSINKIGIAAFRNCENLKQVEVPDLKISYEGFGSESSFAYCISLNADDRKKIRNTGYFGFFDSKDKGAGNTNY